MDQCHVSVIFMVFQRHYIVIRAFCAKFASLGMAVPTMVLSTGRFKDQCAPSVIHPQLVTIAEPAVKSGSETIVDVIEVGREYIPVFNIDRVVAEPLIRIVHHHRVNAQAVIVVRDQGDQSGGRSARDLADGGPPRAEDDSWL